MVGAVDVRPRAKLRLFVVVLAFVDVKTRRCHRSTRPSCKTFHTPSKAIRLLIFSNHLPRFMGYCKTSFLHILTYLQYATLEASPWILTQPFNLHLDLWKSRGFFFSLSPGFFQVYGINLKKIQVTNWRKKIKCTEKKNQLCRTWNFSKV